MVRVWKIPHGYDERLVMIAGDSGGKEVPHNAIDDEADKLADVGTLKRTH